MPPDALAPYWLLHPSTNGPNVSSGLKLMSESAFGVQAPASWLSSVQKIVRRPLGVRPTLPKFAGNAVTSRRLPPSAYTFQRVLPARPRRVVIWTTPFAAAVP